MASVAIALVIVAAVAFIAYPLFARGRADDTLLASAADPTVENLVVQRDAMYAAIRDLESDHVMGKLSDEDYRTMRSKYEGKAVAILRELDGYRAVVDGNEDVTIEQEVKQLRRRAMIERKCVKCGTRAQSNDRFCAKCGTAIGRVVN
ncbi:MAG: zinc ribbon domain-containing protein [Chloroflexi bacterium]|nr:zinc ribbon domain-containing protein [Chloroflexota bacterium]